MKMNLVNRETFGLNEWMKLSDETLHTLIIKSLKKLWKRRLDLETLASFPSTWQRVEEVECACELRIQGNKRVGIVLGVEGSLYELEIGIKQHSIGI